jgi:hypothetical protein
MCGIGIRIFVRKFLTVVTVKIAVLGNVTPCYVVDTDVSGGGNVLLPSSGILKWMPQVSPKRQ